MDAHDARDEFNAELEDLGMALSFPDLAAERARDAALIEGARHEVAERVDEWVRLRLEYLDSYPAATVAHEHRAVELLVRLSTLVDREAPADDPRLSAVVAMHHAIGGDAEDYRATDVMDQVALVYPDQVTDAAALLDAWADIATAEMRKWT